MRNRNIKLQRNSQRERERERERVTDRQTDRQTDRGTLTKIGSEEWQYQKEIGIEDKKVREREKEGGREIEREKEGRE